MRFSMLAYLTRMCRTLLEAAEYLAGRPQGDPVREEISGGALQMMEQIRAQLERHAPDLKSRRPIDCLDEAGEKWRGGEDCAETIRRLIQCLPQDIRYQVRAVFFAELGEKWDAMESVYWFMRNDPRFDPVVVLTPVLREIEIDGEKKRETIYKDYLTPLGIPFLDHDKYSLEEDCPDLAFFSQPYESCTVKQFWPEYIAQYTRLVYLPYYLKSHAVTVKDLQDYYKMGTFYWSWKVLFASEKEGADYRRFSPHKGANELSIGIPKLDWLVNLPEEYPARPAGWERLEGKTVFLWNSWYNYVGFSLRFTDDIFAWFQAHEDCALIWRPHPMTDTTTKLYFPAHYPTLLENMRKIESLPNAVIDREASYRAAYYYSDAMISDYSSLLFQYIFMDKPALLIDSPSLRTPTIEYVSPRWIEQADSAADIAAFMERIRAGTDRKAELRKVARRQDFPLADGRCGERLCEVLWTELHKEALS